MKNFLIFIVLIILSLFVLPVRADVLPLSTNSIKYYGIGVLNLPDNYTVYEEPSENSNIIRQINYNNLKKSAIVNTNDMKKISYIASVPKNNVALVSVESALENDWYCVYINQQTGETGWVYNNDKNSFLTYRQLFYIYGKKYGVRIFNDLPKDKKVLHSAEAQNSQVIDELTFPTFVNFTVIRGNWILISVNDLTKQAKVGWFNWRNDDGTLNMFPNFQYQQ